MKDTPQAERIQITLLGRCNSGKSSLVNALTGQQTAIVSDVAGTTTDPVSKRMEIPELGACLLVDTAGFDDETPLGKQRLEKTLATLSATDVAVMVYRDSDIAMELEWTKRLVDRRIAVIHVVNEVEQQEATATHIAQHIEEQTGSHPLIINAKRVERVEELLRQLALLKQEEQPETLTGGLVETGDVVLLVMPQDVQAPKGRLILPQAQTLRELLDKRCIAVSCTPEQLDKALNALTAPPALVITDSQVLTYVRKRVPDGCRLTTFSILFARYKGKIQTFIEGAKSIEKLTPQSRVLIAEACTHAPQNEDIGREKIPALLRKRIGADLQVDVVSGADFPAELNRYDLVIHCGACMFNRKHVLARIEQADAQGVPITNYGIVIAYLSGVLSEVVY